MRIISFCADGIRDAAKKGFYDWVADQDAEFICIQNLQASEYDLPDKPYFMRDYNAYFFDAVDSKTNGVAIYCKRLPKAIMTGLGFTDFDMEGRYIQADYPDISIGCLLAPSAYNEDGKARNRKAQFFSQYQNHLKKISNKRREFIICGNLNIAHETRDVQNAQANQSQSGFLPEERQWMDVLFSDVGYVDAFRAVNNDADEYTWWPNGERGEDGWRVDYQIVSPGLRSRIEYGAIYKSQVFSSHAPLIMDYDYEME